MSNPTTPGHDYVRPGQVAPDLPPPDNCVRCGLTEAAHAIATYADEATKLDEQLDAAQASIRRRFDAGDITPAEASTMRIEAMEAHLAAIRALRRKHFGE